MMHTIAIVALLLTAITGVAADDTDSLRALKGSKGKDDCDSLQGVPIYDADGGYLSYGTFLSLKGEEKDMTYRNLVQERGILGDLLFKQDPDQDFNANQNYDNIHFVYGGSPAVIDPSKWIFLTVGPIWNFRSWLELDEEGNPVTDDGDCQNCLGYNNFLDWHLGPQRYEIAMADPMVGDSLAFAHADQYQLASLSASFFLFFKNRKLSATINKCQIVDSLSKLVKSDAFDSSTMKKLRYEAYTSFAVLIPPGLDKGVYELMTDYKFAKFYPPNSYFDEDFIEKGSLYRLFCVGTETYCAKKLSRRERSLKLEKKRELTMVSGAGWEANEVDY